MKRFIQVALRPEVYSTAIKVSLLVGTILAFINHSTAILNGIFSTQTILQVLLTYLVPYCVSSYSSTKAILNSER
ncbi:nitrate/nitrite transporter NrtS [Zhongshania aliphaticivorans]|uniref:nitrate/nitrite transporter NrtS n=1 Tax=Zhongshania aliphaticivorans TaxID=1470434 RepID=UPI00190F6645|nr:nitrate/nitrite transporter NrtS [Zhongshania aliphaticivorans]